MTTSPTYQATGDQPEPDQHDVVSGETLTDPATNLAEQDADQAGNENPASHPAIALVPEDLEPANSSASDHRGFVLGGGDARESGMPNPGPENASLAPVAFIAPASMTDSRAASSSASPDGRWNEILGLFVDDPCASTERAASLVDDRVEELIQAFRERQQSLQLAWQANHAGTEELRVAIRHYRAFWNSLEDLPPQT
ncbi:MAG TPA: hypothetical protein VN767_00535 [Streptosporangiaceae bacterium]|nr:hypothetical protein [Streptosporangiaceae bacterium]